MNKNNIISNQWKTRYEKLSAEIKEKLTLLDNADISEYQLQVIKKKRIYPEIGDVFEIRPNEDIILYGVVINNHINNINGKDLILVMIFKQNVNVDDTMNDGIKPEDLLISPVMVGKEYWSRGYFHNVKNTGYINNIHNYGFYSIGKDKFLDEFGNELDEIPQLIGTYGVATIFGISIEITQELIIAGIL